MSQNPKDKNKDNSSNQPDQSSRYRNLHRNELWDIAARDADFDKAMYARLLLNVYKCLQDIDKRLNELEQEEPEPQFSDDELLAIASLVADKYVYYLDKLGNTDFHLNPSAQCIKEIHYKLIRYYAHDEVPEIKNNQKIDDIIVGDEPQFSDEEWRVIAEFVSREYWQYEDYMSSQYGGINPDGERIKPIYNKLGKYLPDDEGLKFNYNPKNLYCVILTPENVLGARSYLAVSAADEKEAKNKVVNWMLDNYEDWIIDPVKFRADVMQQKGLKILSFADSDVVPISLFKALY